jgi:Fe/S biogenesis protein NfuA
MLYGGDEKELFSAAEILYDNGFETFYFIDSYDSLIGGVEASFIKISDNATNYILTAGAIQGIEIIVDPKTDRKANYSIQFIELSATMVLLRFLFPYLKRRAPIENISIDLEKFQVLVAKEAISYLEGTEVDLNDKGELEAFNPSMSITEINGSVEEQIQYVLDEEVNPMVASHGGVVSLLEVKDQNAYLEFGGGCQGCGMIDVTLKQGVEVMIKEQVSEIEAIYDVTDHAGGTNPYYQPSSK